MEDRNKWCDEAISEIDYRIKWVRASDRNPAKEWLLELKEMLVEYQRVYKGR